MLVRCFDAVTQTAILTVGQNCDGGPATRRDRTNGRVTVTQGGAPVPNASVTLNSVPVENTGGHLHANRPQGRFVLSNGLLVMNLTVTTDASGTATFRYQTSGVSGSDQVKGTLPSSKSDLATVRIRFSDALGSSVPVNPLWVVKEASDHGGVPNTYLQPASQVMFDQIVTAYFNEVPEDQRFVNDGVGSPAKIVVTDMSLPEGGLYDWDIPTRAWRNPHKLHRTGQDIDIRSSNLTVYGRTYLMENICRRYTAECYYEGNPKHLHIATFIDARRGALDGLDGPR